MNWLVLTFLAILSRSFQSITSKAMSSSIKVSAVTQSVLFLGVAFILSMVISPFVGGIEFTGLFNSWSSALIMVLSLTVANILFFKGLAKLEASITAIVFSSTLLWGSILSVVFLDSDFDLKQVAGIILLGSAIVFVQYNKTVKGVDSSVLYILLSALLFVIFQVSSADLAKTVPAGTYLLLSFGGSTLLTYLAYSKKVNHELKSLASRKVQVAKATILAAACSTGYFVFSYFAYSQAPDRGIVVVLLTSQVILSVLLGVILLKETDRIPRKLVAGLMALLAGILIKS